MRKLLVIITCTILCGQLATSQSRDEKKLRKEKHAKIAFNATSDLIEGGSYTFVADRTIPSAGSSISLVTNSNHIKISEGKADVYLPYFGIVYAGAGYNHEGGIKYQGDADDYEVTTDENKHRITVTFDIRNGTEVHNFRMSIGKSGYASVIVRSSSRSTITYEGSVKAVEVAMN